MVATPLHHPGAQCPSSFAFGFRATAALTALTLLSALAGPLQGKPKWAAVNPADLAATASSSFPDADAEILFSRHRVDGNTTETWTNHHIQAKIYTLRGVEQSTLFNIRFDRHYKISGLAARIVKPGGTSVELTSSAFHEQTLAKKGGSEFKQTTFAFPDLQPGDVIEYQWTQVTADAYFTHYKFFCEGPVPTREYTFSSDGARSDYTVMWFNCATVEHKEKSKEIVIRNLPAFVEEPLMPAETEFRAWLMILFDHPFIARFYKKESPWDLLGPYIAEEFRLETIPSKAIRARAAELTAGATEPSVRLEQLYRFCQTQVTNLDWSDDASLADVRKKRDHEDEAQTASKTFDRGTGLPADINRLFAALARAAGFEVRVALSADRDDILSINGPRGWIFTDRNSVAVKMGSQWQCFRPGDRPVPAGLLSTHDEGAAMYVCDEKKGWFDTMQSSTAEQNLTRRQGRFTLDADGTLTGEVEIRYAGQRAIRARDQWWKLSADDLAQQVREPVAARLTTAEISDVLVDNLTTYGDPVLLRYKVRVPGFAEPIGVRFAFVPNFFTANAPEVFTAETRRYPVFFDFVEHETDDIELVLPEGYTLDSPSAPVPVHDPAGIIRADYTIRYLPKKRTLSYLRNSVIGGNGASSFRAESYAVLRNLFSRIHQSDTHRLLIKPKVAAPAAAPSEPKPAAATP